MKFRILVLFLLFLPGIGICQNAEYDAAVIKYIMTYHTIAVQEMKIYRIPASITLAQGIFESDAGRSKLAVEANNHFGIKCHKEWEGDTYIKDDETKNECFRKYDNPNESFRDHSWFLSQRDRYKSLFLLDIKDYKGWAFGLKVAGYATNPKYPELLIKTIETYELFNFDNPDYTSIFIDSLREKKDSVQSEGKISQFEILSKGPDHHKIYTINNLKLTIAVKGDTWNEISRLFKLPVRKLYKYNDLKKGARLVSGQIVFLEKKRRKGFASWHIIKPGETMYMISQQNGIQLKRLYKLNGMKSGKYIRSGQKLLLR
jgi:Mannosyl-glycoprotein endo-beta-N-acetylglucosaminidase/LysM domain